MANFKDFAAGLVVTPPSPATSGTSITLRTSDGASFPAPPFYVTACPPGNLTTPGTSEKLLVTGVSGDTLTVVRAQGGFTAKAIDAGWVIANAIYAADVTSSSIVVDEVLSGTINGTNKVFTTASAFSAIIVSQNGLTLHVGAGNDYTVTGTNQITFTNAPLTGDVLTATYIMGSSVMISGSNSLITDETPAGTKDGTNKVFTSARAYVGGSLEVYVNGVKQGRGTHFVETTPSSGTFTFDEAPVSTDIISVNYQYSVAASGNSDTVDGYHANATATPNNIPVLDSNGILPAGTISKTVDANGWTVYNYGSFKIAYKTKPWSVSGLASGGTAFVTVTGNNNPVGFTAGAGFTVATISVLSSSGGVMLNPEAGIIVPNTVYVARNLAASTANYSGNINYQVTF